MITLTVARRADGKQTSGRDSADSVATNSSGTETLGGMKSSGPATPTPDHSGTSETSDGTVVLNLNPSNQVKLF